MVAGSQVTIAADNTTARSEKGGFTVTDATSKNKIVFVPGKNPKPRPDVHRALLWRCLLRGLHLVDPAIARSIAAHPEAFVLISWNRLFYGVEKEADEDQPWIEALCHKSGPDAADVHEALSWRNKLARFLYLVADHLPFLIPLLPDPAVKSAVVESERYFHDHEGIGAQVREAVKVPLREMLAAGDRILLVGHSMGSIIAYDALWELDHVEHNPGRIDLLLTLGSPLGMHYVQAQLLGRRDHDDRRFPCNIGRWVNVAAHGDLTALDPELRGHFGGMLEEGCTGSIEDRHDEVFTWFRNELGFNAHRSYGYLVEAHTARAVAAWWLGADEAACCPADGAALAAPG